MIGSKELLCGKRRKESDEFICGSLAQKLLLLSQWSTWKGKGTNCILKNCEIKRILAKTEYLQVPIHMQADDKVQEESMYRTTLTVGLYPAMVHAIIYANWCSEVDIGYDYCGQRYYPLLFHGCLDISHGWHQVELDNNNGNITAVGNTCDIHLKYILSKFGTWNMILAAQQIHIKNTRPSMVNKLVQQFVIYTLDPASQQPQLGT